MGTVKKQKGLLLLTKEKIDCYIHGSSGIVSLTLPPNVVRSMEVIDKNALVTLVKTFITTNKILSTECTLIIHQSILFEKLIPSVQSLQPVAPPSQYPAGVSAQPVQTPPVLVPSTPVQPLKETKASRIQQLDDEEKVIEQFVETVPFDEVLMKTHKLPQGKMVYVVNKQLVVQIKDAFEQAGCSIDAVYPASLFGKEAQLETGLVPAGAALILPKIDSMRSQNMLIEEKPQPLQTGPVSLGMPQKEGEKKRLVIMAGVFIVLIGIMVVVFLRMNEENARLDRETAERNRLKRVASPSAQIVVTPTDVIPASTSAAVKQSLPIEFITSPQRASTSAQLQAGLREAGYAAITQAQGRVNSSTLIIFSPGVPQDVREEIIGLVIAFDETAAVQENTEELPSVSINF